MIGSIMNIVSIKSFLMWQASHLCIGMGEAPYNVLILDCLNVTLEESISKHYDISIVFSYASQMVFLFSALYNPGHLAYIILLQLSCLESIHSQDYIH